MSRRLLSLILALPLAVLLASGQLAPPPPDVLPGAIGRGPAVVLVHGLGSRSTHWLPLTRDLGRDHRIVAADLPGHGLAAMPGRLTIDQAARSLERVLDAQPGPVILVGHSVGGLVATAAALRAPDRVRALVLVETALSPMTTPEERAELRAALDRDFEGTVAAVYRSFGRDSAQGEALAREVLALDPAMVRAWIEMVLDLDLRDAAAGLECPVLAVVAPHSWEDGERWADCARALGLDRIRHVQPLRVEASGHFVSLDAPHVLAEAIRQFDRAPAPAPPAIATLAAHGAANE